VRGRHRFLLLVIGGLLWNVCSGCGNPYPGTPRNEESNPHPLNATSEDFVLSEDGEAVSADIVTGADEEIHVLYTEGQDANTVTYRLSTNRGRTWGPGVNLTETSEPTSIGAIRLLRDSNGLMYAFWKSLPDNAAKAGEPEGTWPGVLTCRVLQGNFWSKPFSIGPSSPSALYSWFACTDPQGRVHVVWNQSHPITGTAGARFTGTILQAELEGTTVSIPKTLRQFPPPGQESGYTAVRYSGLHGYVNAHGIAHWVAQRQQSCASPATGGCKSGQEIVYWNGTNEMVLSDLAEAVKFSPQLLVDAHGSDHVITTGQQGSKPCLLDILPGLQEEPIPALILPITQGGLRGFQVAQGAKGEMAVLAEAEDASQGRLSFQYNLYAGSFDGANWSKTANVTDAASRLLSDQATSNSTDPVTVLSARHAIGAFDASGETLYLLLIADATGVNLNEQNHSEVHITTSGSGAGGSLIFRPFHIKLP